MTMGHCGHYGWLCVLGICCFLAIRADAAAVSEAGRARDCILAARDAIDAADTRAFDAAVDVETVLDHAVGVVAGAAARGGENVPPVLALMFSPLSHADAARRLLVRETAAFVRNGIASGAFAGGKGNGTPAPQGMLAPLFAGVSTGRKEIVHVSPAIRGEGGAWIVPFDLLDGGNGQRYRLLGRVERRHSRWRLTAIENMDELFHRLCGEFAAQEP